MTNACFNLSVPYQPAAIGPLQLSKEKNKKDQPSTAAASQAPDTPSIADPNQSFSYGIPACRSISLDTGYFELNASSAQARLGQEMFDLITWPIDVGTQNSELGNYGAARWFFWLPEAIAVNYVIYAYLLTVHEFGHAGRIDAFGQESFTGFFHYPEPGVQDNRYFDSPHAYFGYALLHPGEGGFTGIYNDQEGSVSAEQDALISANGVNANVFYGEQLSDQTYTRGQHFLNFFTLGQAQLAAALYVLSENYNSYDTNGGDMAHLAEYYQQQGYDISMRDIAKASKDAFLLSADTYAFGLGNAEYIFKGRIDPVQSWHIGPLRLPNMHSYLMPKGITQKITSGITLGEHLKIPLAVETVIKGDRSVGEEYTLGTNISVDPIYAGAALLSSVRGSTGFDLNAGMRIGRILVSEGLTQFDRDTFFGQRHAPDLSVDKSYEFWARVSWLY